MLVVLGSGFLEILNPRLSKSTMNIIRGNSHDLGCLRNDKRKIYIHNLLKYTISSFLQKKNIFL